MCPTCWGILHYISSSLLYFCWLLFLPPLYISLFSLLASWELFLLNQVVYPDAADEVHVIPRCIQMTVWTSLLVRMNMDLSPCKVVYSVPVTGFCIDSLWEIYDRKCGQFNPVIFGLDGLKVIRLHPKRGVKPLFTYSACLRYGVGYWFALSEVAF